MTELLKVAQVAEELAVSRQTVRNLINSGKLEVIQVGESSKSDRIERRELERYKRAQRRNRAQTGAKPPKVVQIRKPNVRDELDRLLG